MIYSSYDFEVVCKNALIKLLKDKYNEDHFIEDFDMTWFNYTLQHYKAMLIDRGPNQRYYECTFNIHNNRMFIDIYEKQSNTVVTGEYFDHEVKQRREK